MRALLPALFFISCSKQPAASQAAPGAAPDSPAPKKVSLAFARAVASGDIGGMKSVAIGTTGRVFAFYVSLANTVTAEHRFKAALVARFGDDCEIPPDIESIGNMNPLPPDYDSLTEKIDGDTATLVNAAGKGGLKFKKITGEWKVDFDAVDAGLPAGGAENMARQQAIFDATVKAFDVVTAKIAKGVYPDCKAAVDDVMLPHP